MDSPDFYCYFWAYPFLLFSFSVFHFLVAGSVRQIKLTHVGFRAHVKIASRIVSYRKVVAVASQSHHIAVTVVTVNNAQRSDDVRPHSSRREVVCARRAAPVNRPTPRRRRPPSRPRRPRRPGDEAAAAGTASAAADCCDMDGRSDCKAGEAAPGRRTSQTSRLQQQRHV